LVLLERAVVQPPESNLQDNHMSTLIETLDRPVRRGLSLQSLEKCVPAAFATHGFERTGPKYAFISTRDLLESLLAAGFYPADARQRMLRGWPLLHDQVGQLAAKANVKMVVLAHIWDVGEEDVAEIKKYYSGKVVVGSDLLAFLLGVFVAFADESAATAFISYASV
jgi:hypothetical protein